MNTILESKGDLPYSHQYDNFTVILDFCKTQYFQLYTIEVI